MPFKKLFKSKRKIGRMESISRSLPADHSGILTRDFPYLSSRAKSPTDVLDLVGYPHFAATYSPVLLHHQQHHQSDEKSVPQQSPPIAASSIPSPQQQQQRPIRPTVGPRRASFHSFSYDEALPSARKRSVSTPPPLAMPRPVNAVPPTQSTVLRPSAKDKTQIASGDEGGGGSPLPNAGPAALCTQELESIYRQLQQYQHEQKQWLRREKERRRREDWMYAKLCELQQQLEQLSTRVVTAGGDPQQQQQQQSDMRRRVDHEEDEEGDEGDEGHYYTEDEDVASSGYASEDGGGGGDTQDDAARRHYYYYYQHPATYQHPRAHRRRPWSPTVVANAYYPPHPHQYRPARFAYPRRSWPVRRRKSSDASVRSVPNLIRRSSSSASRYQGHFPHDERVIRNRRAPINMIG